MIVAAVATAIVKHHLLNIKVIVSEVFAVLLLLVVLLQALVAPTVPSLLGQFATLLIASVLGALLIRSVRAEVQCREVLPGAHRDQKPQPRRHRGRDLQAPGGAGTSIWTTPDFDRRGLSWVFRFADRASAPFGLLKYA